MRAKMGMSMSGGAARGLAALVTMATLGVLGGPAAAAAAAPGDNAGRHAGRHGDEDVWALHQETTVAKTFTLAAAGRRTVEILNFDGSVVVHSRPGAAGSEVVMSLRQSWSADVAAKIEEAQHAVQLEVSQAGGGLRLYVDGPFRSRDGGIDFHGWKSVGYQARFDFDVEVPPGVDVIAKTVNGGDVSATGLGGHYELANVNGGVTLAEMSGAGSANTVNGAIHAAFSRNPGEGCTFKTINGEIDVRLRSGLSADLRFKTLNGDVYTDFPYTLRDLPATPADTADSTGTADRSRPARFHYKSRGEFAARVGAGGPEFAFSTINGNILIHRQDA
jgi:hypothetical protein